MSEIDKIRDFYDKVYYKGAQNTVHPSRHLVKLAGRLNINFGEEILDVACGKGEWLLTASEKGARTAGIDISSKAVDICKNNLPKGEFFVGRAETLPFTDGRFDIVTCLGSLEHFVDKLAALGEMVRVAKPNARFLILVPNDGFYLRRLGIYKGTKQIAAREDVLSLEKWRALFEEGGLRVEDQWGDLHIMSSSWITEGSLPMWPVRLAVALSMTIAPLSLQYQVYHLCEKAL